MKKARMLSSGKTVTVVEVDQFFVSGALTENQQKTMNDYGLSSRKNQTGTVVAVLMNIKSDLDVVDKTGKVTTIPEDNDCGCDNLMVPSHAIIVDDDGVISVWHQEAFKQQFEIIGG